jgi:F-type H+-transporting ATPase subunit epsilon
LRPGVVSFTNEFEAEQKLFISSGFVEVQPHIVMVLADTVMHTKNLDDAAALAAMERAQKAIVARPRRRIGTNS